MKICAVIAEYNPFHFGHLNQLKFIKEQLSANKIIVIMSGNFTQRGEGAILGKFTRAVHACEHGADMVVELPTVHATANAELFAKGAVKILKELGVVDCLCFGAEDDQKQKFVDHANLLKEDKEFKNQIKKYLDEGFSLVSAKHKTLEDVYGESYDKEFAQKPNNILGIEYVRAIIENGNPFDFVPILRTNDHNDDKMKKTISSSTAIRKEVLFGKYKKVKNAVPKKVFHDLRLANYDLDVISLSAMISAKENSVKNVLDCTEGLENRIKSLIHDSYTVDNAVDKISTKRYTKSRIKRIFVANMLEIDKNIVFEALEQKTYAKVLAMRQDAMEIVKEINEKSTIPLLIRKSDVIKLSKFGKTVFEKDILANSLYNLNAKKRQNEFYTAIIKPKHQIISSEKQKNDK